MWSWLMHCYLEINFLKRKCNIGVNKGATSVWGKTQVLSVISTLYTAHLLSSISAGSTVFVSRDRQAGVKHRIGVNPHCTNWQTNDRGKRGQSKLNHKLVNNNVKMCHSNINLAEMQPETGKKKEMQKKWIEDTMNGCAKAPFCCFQGQSEVFCPDGSCLAMRSVVSCVWNRVLL